MLIIAIIINCSLNFSDCLESICQMPVQIALAPRCANCPMPEREREICALAYACALVRTLSLSLGYTTTTDDRELESETKLKKSHTHTCRHTQPQVPYLTTPHTHTHSRSPALPLSVCSRDCLLTVLQKREGEQMASTALSARYTGGTLALQLAIKRQAASTLHAASQQKTAKQKSENRKFIANESHDNRAVHKCNFLLLLQSQQQQILTRIIVVSIEKLEEPRSPTNSLCRSLSKRIRP